MWLLDERGDGGERTVWCWYGVNPTYGRSGLASSALALAILSALLLVDLVDEMFAGTSVFHAGVDGSAVVAGCVAVGAILRRMRLLRHETHELREDLATSRADTERWSRDARKLIEGLSAAIDEQLVRWGLSQAEKDIAQARSLYRKAGLAGRHELAAFFLEDLLGPRPSPARS